MTPKEMIKIAELLELTDPKPRFFGFEMDNWMLNTAACMELFSVIFVLLQMKLPIGTT